MPWGAVLVTKGRDSDKYSWLMVGAGKDLGRRFHVHIPYFIFQ
jgi:hypothetical protein